MRQLPGGFRARSRNFSRITEHSGPKGNWMKGGSLPKWEARVARFPHLPMVEDRQGKGLPLGMSSEISLKAE